MPVRNYIDGWTAAWSADMPPHSYSLLRIVLGGVALISLAGLLPIDMFWALDGLTPVPSDGAGPRPWLYAHGFGTLAGWVLFIGFAAVFVAVIAGYRSETAVIAAFAGLVGQAHWNTLPLSSAQQVLIVLFFCLTWAQTGRVWSVDAYRLSGGDADPPARVPIWPLLLLRFQIALIYGSSALWKISYPDWRDGSAVYWALNLNSFHRLPWEAPPEWAPLFAFLTWGTLLFELSFPLLVLFRRTRPFVLIAGIGLHVGLWATMELGPFSLVMIGSYLSFIDPEIVPRLVSSRRPWRLAKGAAGTN